MKVVLDPALCLPPRCHSRFILPWRLKGQLLLAFPSQSWGSRHCVKHHVLNRETSKAGSSKQGSSLRHLYFFIREENFLQKLQQVSRSILFLCKYYGVQSFFLHQFWFMKSHFHQFQSILLFLLHTCVFSYLPIFFHSHISLLLKLGLFRWQSLIWLTLSTIFHNLLPSISLNLT